MGNKIDSLHPIAWLARAGRFWLPAFGLLFAMQAGAATLTVTTLVDNTDNDSQCSLREALRNADMDSQFHNDCAAGTGDDVIEFDAGLFSGSPPEATIMLTGQLTVGSGGGPSGALSILPPANHRIVLQGSGSDALVLLGARATPFLLQDAEIRGGRSTSGAGVTVSTPVARFVRVRFVDNIAEFGGAIFRSASTQDGLLQIDRCHFEDNVATNGSGGAVSMANGGPTDFDITISESVFVNNTANFDGGAVFVNIAALANPGTPSLDIATSRFQGNLANRGGALAIEAGTADSRIAASITDSAFRNNRARNIGGAIDALGDAQGNQQDLVVRRSTLMDNGVDHGSSGGAIALANMGFSLENSLFAGNDATTDGGALSVRNQNSTLPRAVRLVGNSFYLNQLTAESFTFARTLSLRAPADATGWQLHIAGNLVDPDPEPIPGSGSECILFSGQELVLTGGANLSADPNCLFFAGDTEADPQVALTSTGNPLKPRSLMPRVGSPAIDLWPAADCNGVEGAPLTDDLREEPRPRDGDGTGSVECDAGAFEFPDASLVSVSLAGTGTGTITSNPAGINCGATCSAGFADGSEVTLTAAADPGSAFVGWSGDCSGTESCVLQIDGDKNVTASFDNLPSHTLELLLTGDGSGQVSSTPSGLDCEPHCAASFAEGTEITLTTTSGAYSVFDGWSGGGCSGTGDCIVTLNADTSVSAAFRATHFPVTVNLAGTGSGSVTSNPAGIACPDDCEETFARAATLTLTASPASGSVFSQWEGDCSGSGDCVLDMDAGPYTVTARFVRLRTLSVGLAGGGGGNITSNPAGIDCPGDCSETYVHGGSVDLLAVADTGSTFAGWSGACSGTGACSVLMDADKSVTATFQTGSFSLGVTVTGSGTVTSSPAGINCPGDCSETYLAGTAVELISAPASGYHFVHWSGDCSGTGACTITMDQARSVEAVFEQSLDEIFSDRFEEL